MSFKARDKRVDGLLMFKCPSETQKAFFLRQKTKLCFLRAKRKIKPKFDAELVMVQS